MYYRTEKAPGKKWKKALLLFLGCFVLLRIGYILFRGEIDKEYFTSGEYEQAEKQMVPCRELSQRFVVREPRLNSLEFLFDGMTENNSGRIILAVTLEGEPVYETRISLSDSDNGIWKKVYLNAEVQEGKEYELCLDTEEGWENDPEILTASDPCAEEIRTSCEAGQQMDNHIAVKYGYLRTPDIFDRLLVSSLWMLGFFGFCFLVQNIEKIQAPLRFFAENASAQLGRTVFVCISELILVQVIIGCSGLELQSLTKVILYGISILSALNCTEKRNHAKNICRTTGQKAAFIALCVYAAFALVGQRLFIYPLNKKILLGDIAVFFCAVLWFTPVMESFLYDFDIVSNRVFGPEKRLKTWLFILIGLLLLLIPAAYNLAANNPGIADVDTYEAFEKNAQNLYGMYNWHPAFYSLILHKLQQIWNSTYMVIIAQYFFWGYVLTELMLYLRRKGMRDSALLLFAFLNGFNAANLLHLNTIWKDIPYTYALLWTMVLMAKLALEPDYYRKKWYIYAELFLALLLVSMLRKNGIVIFIVCALVLLFQYRKNIKAIVTVAAVLAMIFYIQGPIYDRYMLVEPGRRGIYIGLGQDVLGAYYGGGEVSEKTLKMINVMTHHNNAEYDYTPTWAHQNYDLDVEPVDFVLCYLDTFFRNPVLVLRAVVDREDALWDIFRGEDSVVQNTNFTDTMDGYGRWNEFYPERVFRSIEPGMSTATKRTTEIQWLDVLIWRCGFLTLLSVSSIFCVTVRRKNTAVFVILAPVIGQILSLLLSTGWTDYRYFWPMNVVNLSLILFSLAIAHGAETHLQTE